MKGRLPGIYYGVFGGVALFGTIFCLINRMVPLAIFNLIGLSIIGFWYYKMKGG